MLLRDCLRTNIEKIEDSFDGWQNGSLSYISTSNVLPTQYNFSFCISEVLNVYVYAIGTNAIHLRVKQNLIHVCFNVCYAVWHPCVRQSNFLHRYVLYIILCGDTAMRSKLDLSTVYFLSFWLRLPGVVQVFGNVYQIID